MTCPDAQTGALDGEDEQLYAEARHLAKAWLADRKAIDPDMDGTILHLAARHGDAALFDAFLAPPPPAGRHRPWTSV